MTTNNCSQPNPKPVEALFHWNTKPEDRTTTCRDSESQLLARNSDPASIIAFFVNLFQQYFSDPANISNDALRDLVRVKPLVVASLSDFDTDVAGDKPCVYIEYGGKKAQVDFAFDNQVGYNPDNGSREYCTRWQMGFTFYVVGKTLQETLNLSEEICNVCHVYQAPIKDVMHWVRFQVAEVQKAQSAEQGDGFLAAVSVIIVVNYPWVLFDSSPKLKRVVMHVQHAAGYNTLDADE